MEKSIITFSANEQNLQKTGGIGCYASDTVSYIEAHFALGENWSGYDSIRAVWFNDYKTISTVLDSDGVCIVPHEVLVNRGKVMVNLVGSVLVSDELSDRLTTYPCEALKVSAKAKISGSETAAVTPSQFEQFVSIVISEVEKVTGMTAQAETLPAGSQATARYEDGILYLGIPQGIQGERGRQGEAGADGNGIASVVYNADYTLTLIFDNGEQFTTPPIRGERGPAGADGTDGADGVTPNISIGNVTTLEPSEDAYVTRRGTDANPIFDFGIPKGDKGDTGEVSLDELLNNTIIQTLTDTEPYNFRPTPSCGSLEYDEIVGASVGWNQLAPIASSSKSAEVHGLTITDNRDGSYSVSGTASAEVVFKIKEMSWAAHKYLFCGCPKGGANSTYSVRMYGAGSDAIEIGNGGIWNASGNTWKAITIYAKSGTVITNPIIFKPQIFDLTLMLGSTIADYVYSLETATAGAGVAWLKSHFDCFNSYQPFNSGSIESVNGLEAHVMRDSSDNIIGNYPLDSSLTLRGIYKMDSSHNLYADGDVYKADGTVTRKYGVVDLGTLAWTKDDDSGLFYTASIRSNVKYVGFLVCGKYACVRSDVASTLADKSMCVGNSQAYALLRIKDSAYASATASDFKTAMNGVYLVYELATPTTETADPYTNPQQVESGGTEEYASTSIVPIGHETEYPMTLKDTMPTTDGSYTMSLTVSNGKPKVTWTSGTTTLSMTRTLAKTDDTETELTKSDNIQLAED